MINLFFSFKGRIDRKWFWLGSLAVVFSLYLVGVVVQQFFVPWYVGLLFLVPLYFSFYALAAKRYHDLDMSGWYSVIFLFPVVGWIYVVFECGLLEGGAMKNRYGAPLHGPLVDGKSS